MIFGEFDTLKIRIANEKRGSPIYMGKQSEKRSRKSKKNL